MIAKILAWFTDSKVSIVAGIAASVVIFFCGYGMASNKYKAEIEELERLRKEVARKRRRQEIEALRRELREDPYAVWK